MTELVALTATLIEERKRIRRLLSELPVVIDRESIRPATIWPASTARRIDVGVTVDHLDRSVPRPGQLDGGDRRRRTRPGMVNAAHQGVAEVVGGYGSGDAIAQ